MKRQVEEYARNLIVADLDEAATAVSSFRPGGLDAQAIVALQTVARRALEQIQSSLQSAQRRADERETARLNAGTEEEHTDAMA